MRIAIGLDEELPRRLFAERVGHGHAVYFAKGGAELRKLALTGGLEVAVVGVLNRHDLFWPAALRELAASAPALALVGVVEPLRPSLDEAAELASEIPGMGFVARPDLRFDRLARRRSPDEAPPTFSRTLLECVRSLPVADVGRDFALLQSLVPSLASGIPEQAAFLGAGRRKLERWFQGPDICSARRLQSVCAAAEAMYLRLRHDVRDREIAGVIGLLTRDGAPNPIGVAREIRAVFGEDREAVQEGGEVALADFVYRELRRARRPGNAPARWEPSVHYRPAEGVLAVPEEGRVLLVPPRGVTHPLDEFGAEVWELMGAGASFNDLAAELASRRRESRAQTFARLRELLGALLVLGLVRRGANGGDGTSTAEEA
jgi:hypothetical protein